jgi:hypothetical protein
MSQKDFPITDAGHKFLELYAEPVVTNTYLKVAILVLSVVALALLALLYRAQTAASRLKPLVISVSDIGRGQVMNYDDLAKFPWSASANTILPAGPRSTTGAITPRCSATFPNR